MTTFHEISSKYIVKAFHILTMNICHYSLFCFVFGKLVLLNYYNRYRLSRERKKSNLQRLISSDFHILFYLKSSERWSRFCLKLIFGWSSICNVFNLHDQVHVSNQIFSGFIFRSKKKRKNGKRRRWRRDIYDIIN